MIRRGEPRCAYASAADLGRNGFTLKGQVLVLEDVVRVRPDANAPAKE